MGLIVDTSILIAAERGKFDLEGFLEQFGAESILITAVIASELLHGVERGRDAASKSRRQRFVEQILGSLAIIPFDLEQARVHARIWADLESRGQMIVSHDLQIAATCLAYSHTLATLNVDEFHRVPGLKVVDGLVFRR